MFGAKFCYETIPYETNPFDWEAFKNDPMDFYAVATDVESGTPVYHLCESLDKQEMEWIRASASMPLAARIVEIDGHKLLDGGISDSVPLKFFEQLGYSKNVIILTQPKGYVKSPSSLMGLVKLKYKKYPKLVKTLENRHNEYNETTAYIEEKESRGEVFVIRPPEALPVGRIEHDPEKIKKAYEIGRKTATALLDDLKEFLNNNEV
jgi:predicted patatin/cPLA2 family phospholipase